MNRGVGSKDNIGVVWVHIFVHPFGPCGQCLLVCNHYIQPLMDSAAFLETIHPIIHRMKIQKKKKKKELNIDLRDV